MALLTLVSPACAFGQGAKPDAKLPVRIEPAAQKLIDQTIAALGGKAFLGIKTVTSSGRLYYISQGQTAGIFPFTSELEYPDKSRVTLSMATSSAAWIFLNGPEGDTVASKRPVVLINNGTQAWELDRNGVDDQPSEEVRSWQITNRYSLENLLRLRIHEPGALVQEGGLDFVENRPVRVLKFYDTLGAQVTLDINQDSDLPLRITIRDLNAKTGRWEEFAHVFSDYQKIQGIETPMEVTAFYNGRRVSEFFCNTVSYNPTYPASDFEAHE